LATRKKTKAEFSVKRVVRKDLHPRDVAALSDEISVLRAVADCDYVIRLKEVYEDADYTCIVMERINGESLIDRLIANKKLTEFDAKELARNLLLGIAYCHKKRIANRNLKLENLNLVSCFYYIDVDVVSSVFVLSSSSSSSSSSSRLLCRRETHSTLSFYQLLLLQPAGSDQRKLKICDFEFAKLVHFPNSLHTQCGTQEYVAPEVLENLPAYDVSCDIWTVGVIIFIMLGGYYPFRGKNEIEVLKKVRYGEFVFHDKYWKGISEDAKSLIKSMMTVDPQQRITADDALGSAWIKADVSVLSADLSDNMQELKEYVKSKFKGLVKTIIATNKLQAIGESTSSSGHLR
jgi:calcium-dependent protein kinase